MTVRQATEADTLWWGGRSRPGQCNGAPSLVMGTGAGVASAPALRPDLQIIADFVPAGCKLLDLGCGDGVLLEHLVQSRQVKGRGVELSEAGVLACVRRGLSVRQGDLQEGFGGLS